MHKKNIKTFIITKIDRRYRVIYNKKSFAKKFVHLCMFKKIATAKKGNMFLLLFRNIIDKGGIT